MYIFLKNYVNKEKGEVTNLTLSLGAELSKLGIVKRISEKEAEKSLKDRADFVLDRIEKNKVITEAEEKLKAEAEIEALANQKLQDSNMEELILTINELEATIKKQEATINELEATIKTLKANQKPKK